MNAEHLTLLHINVERDRHIDNIKRLLIEQQPDVACFNEIPAELASVFAGVLNHAYRFSPMGTVLQDDKVTKSEIGIMTSFDPSLQLIAEQEIVYHNSSGGIWNSHDGDSYRRVLLISTFHKNEIVYRIGATHFTWTPDGKPSEVQRNDMRALLSALEQKAGGTGIVFCGDFNAPRGGEIYAMMSRHYHDNLPLTVTTTLDQSLHRAAPIMLSVDSVFSSKEYSVTMREPIFGVSDHCALVADIQRNV